MVADPRLVSREKGRMSLAAFRAEFGHLEQKRVERYVGWWIISPSTAQTLLDRFNKKNRHINKNRIRAYAADIRAGRWIETGEPLIITEDGICATGQHVLLAIIESGISVVRLVVVGVPREAIYYVDLGRSKQLKDFFQIDNLRDPNGYASAITLKAMYDARCMNDPQVASTLTVAHKRAEIEAAHPGIAKCLAEIPDPTPGFGGRSLWAWLFYEFQERDAGLARDFVWQALEGTNVSRSSAVFSLRRMLERKSASKSRGTTLSRTFVAAVIIKTWNRARRGEGGVTLVWKSGEPFPEIE